MVQIDIDGFLLTVPLDQHMHVKEFLELADRVEHIAGHHAAHRKAPEPLPAPELPLVSIKEEFRFDKEDEVRFQHMMNQMKAHAHKMHDTEGRLEQHERHIQQMLRYLNSLDKYLKKPR